MKKTANEFLQAFGDYLANLNLVTQALIAFVILMFLSVIVHRLMISFGFKSKTNKK